MLSYRENLIFMEFRIKLNTQSGQKRIGRNSRQVKTFLINQSETTFQMSVNNFIVLYLVFGLKN